MCRRACLVTIVLTLCVRGPGPQSGRASAATVSPPAHCSVCERQCGDMLVAVRQAGAHGVARLGYANLASALCSNKDKGLRWCWQGSGVALCGVKGRMPNMTTKCCLAVPD